jgi:hypothetical protein
MGQRIPKAKPNRDPVLVKLEDRMGKKPPLMPDNTSRERLAQLRGEME